MKLFRGLLVSCARNLEKACMSEMLYTMVEHLEMSRSKVKAHMTGISGLVSIRIDKAIEIEPVVRKLIQLDKDTPFFIHTLKIRPIEKVIEADYEGMRDEIPDLVEGMEGKFRITVAKRHSNMSSSMIIEAAAPLITNEVSLDHPDWDFAVEIIGNKMGLSAISSDLVYSTQKAMMENESDDWFLDD